MIINSSQMTERRAMTARMQEVSLGELVMLARRLATSGTDGTHRRILGITGAPGAGKSTLAEQLVNELGSELAVLVPMDGYHLANSVLESMGMVGRKGAHDTFDVSGYAALLHRLRKQPVSDDDIVYAPEFRRNLEEPIGSAVAIASGVPLVITEGNYLLLETGLWPRVRSSIDEVWYLSPPEELRHQRLINRHEAYGKSQHEARLWALGSDEKNAELISLTASRADLLIRVS